MKYRLLLALCFTYISTFCLAGSAGKKDSTSSSTEITIMTYNVKMLPRGATFLHHHPVIRARLIPEKLIAENPDVIVFEEAFDGKSDRILRQKLSAVYPYNMGFQNRKLISYKRAGGVLIFSKYPMKEIESIKYSECKGTDCMGHKGAMLVEVSHPAGRFQLLGTHMQAGGSVELKTSQYAEAGALLRRHQEQGIPQFAAGDFNTRSTSTDLYPLLVKNLDVQNGEISGDLKFSSDHLLNDMYNYNPDKRNIIDFVFYRANGTKYKSVRRYIRNFEQRWSKDHKDLSDHFAVVMKMQL